MTGSLEKYREYCKKETTIPLFLTHGWLSTVIPEGQWGVSMVERGGELFAALPYRMTSKWGFRVIDGPMLTPYLGVWIRYPEGQKEGTRLSYEKEIMFELIDGLPDFSYFRQSFFPQITNGLPFHWKGFRQTSRYTYVLEKPQNLEVVFGDVQQNIRRQIKKAERSLKVVESDLPAQLYQFKQLSYKENNRYLPISRDYFERIYQHCKQQGCGLLLSAEDENGNAHAMIYLVWDHLYCYYLFGAAKPEFKNSGAMSLLMWEGIRFASEKNLSFNFEGSMVEAVERFFRGFGAKQQTYMLMEKSNSALYNVLRFIRKH